MVKMRFLLAVALAAVTMVPAAALATHMGNYANNPVEHDDQGRSYEPDFQSTGVLGVALQNCIVSLTLAPGCIPDSALSPAPGQSSLLAPGCTDDAGRQPSGLCGLFTIGAGNANAQGVGVPPGTVGVQGMTGNAAPGRFTPTKDRTIRFLDSRLDYQLVPPASGTQYIDYNSKLLDTGVASALAGIDPSLGSFAVLPGGTSLWAWYGYWQDKNGNGVVDHLRSAVECTGTSCPADGGVAVNNEFTWIGTCRQFNGQAAPPGQRYCSFEASTLMPVWVFPGNHHAFCGAGFVGPECGVSPTDYPGHEITSYLLFTSCPSETCIQEMTDVELYFGGDPLLGDQNSRHVDTNGAGEFGATWGMGDRTGDPRLDGRQWVFGNGFATWFWDQSLIVTTMVITGVTKDAAVPGLETDFELSKLLAVDVDRYSSWSPAAGALLQDQVKPTARSNWVFVREIIAAEDAAGQANDIAPAGTRLTYDQCDPNVAICLGTDLSPTLSRLQDRIFDPGFAKEPNTAGDVFPGAVRGVCADAFQTHQGQCNTYAGYAAAMRGWLEVQDNNAIYTNLAWSTPIGPCVLCVTSTPDGTPNLPDGLRAENTFNRVLDPGTHVFSARVGGWKDRAQFHEESALDVLGTITSLALDLNKLEYTVPADGWIGDIVNSTGFDRLSGFLPEACPVYGVTGTFEYAQCHPYADGNIGDPQDYNSDPSTGDFEFVLGERGTGTLPNGNWQLIIRPADGCWSVPVFVWRQFDTWQIGNTGAIVDFSGTCSPITMDMGSGPGFANIGFATKDVLILPQGNAGEVVVTEMSGRAVVKSGGVPIVDDFVRDVDVYAPYGSP